MMVLRTQSQCSYGKFHFFMQINLLFASFLPIDFFYFINFQVPFLGLKTMKISNIFWCVIACYFIWHAAPLIC